MEGRRQEFEARLDTIGWGVLFVTVGAVLLIPDLPSGAWLVAVGVVLVGVSLARIVAGLPAVGTTAVVGIAALVAGIAGMAGLDSEAGPLVMVAVGVALIGNAAYRTQLAGQLGPAGREGR